MAYQDVDFEHGGLASEYIHMTPSNHKSTFAEGFVAYQDVDIEHGVLASVMRAKWRCLIHSHDTKRPHINVCKGFSFLGLAFL